MGAYQKIDQLREPAAFPGWFKRIVHSQCKRIIRRFNRRIETLEAAPERDGIVDRGPHLQQMIALCLEHLPRHEYVVVRMFYWERYSYLEISKDLGLPVSTIKKRLYSARQRLKEIW